MTMRINDNGTDRDMTAVEIELHKTFAADAAAQAKLDKATAVAKAAARQAVLDKLGLTADEITALLG